MKFHTYPVEGLLPKLETEAASFQLINPEYDGRGTIVAILDTGVDPGSPGMAITTDGRSKLIDIVDCTGSGDVDCSTIIKETTKVTCKDGSVYETIVGLSGRTLKLGKWNNPTGVYRIGLKNSKEIFPKELERITNERKDLFLEKHNTLLTKVQKEAIDYDKSESPDQLMKADHEARFDVLRDLMKSYQDPGIIMDCVLFHDGQKWRAAIDTDESGDLTKVPILTNYRDELQYATFSIETMLNYSVNIYDEGQTLSIVTCGGTHGNHVASIVGANFPEDPRLNGVAPGCQIISLKVGDHRLGTMETGTGVNRAAIELARWKVDVANLSYGEAAHLQEYGKFIDLLKDEVVNKNGTIFVSSAGNAGPALTTVGAPGGVSTEFISVGAYVNHSMMEAEYAMLDKVPERPYTWSSRGPAFDGDIAVDVFALGAAVTSVPQYTIQRTQLMNGTSMSSPNCAGCVSLLVSGLKKEKIDYTPYKIKAALKQTAKSVNDPMGIGLVQVEKAWRYLTNTAKDYFPSSLHYLVNVNQKNGARGIYLRESYETNTMQEFTVKVVPKFPNAKDPYQNLSKLGMELQIALEASDDWISCPEYAVINNAGKDFNVRVDPTNLSPGFHFGTIIGYDANNKSVGGLFKVPVTVCKPDTPTISPEGAYVCYEGLKFNSGDIIRHFVQVPPNSNFAEVILSTKGRKTPGRFVVHLMQLNPQTPYTRFENEQAYGIQTSGVEGEINSYKNFFPVIPNVTLEVCLAQYWSSLDPSSVTIEIKFHGILVSASSVTHGTFGICGTAGGNLIPINSGLNGFTRLDAFAPIRREDFAPKITFDAVRQTLRPSDSFIRPLLSRDILPNGQHIHELILSYTVKISEPVSVKLTSPRFEGIIYESSFENFALIVFDANKKKIHHQDVTPKELKLNEGDYLVKIQVSSSDVNILVDLKPTPLIVETKLSKSVSPPLAKSVGDLPKDNFKKGILSKGEKAVIWVGDIGALPKEAKAGDLLVGSLKVTGASVKLPGDLYTVSYVVPPEYKAKTVELGIKEPAKEDKVLLKEAVRDLEISWVKKTKSDDGKRELIKSLEQAYPDHLPLFVEKLEILAEFAQKEVEAGIISLELSSERIEAANKIFTLFSEGDVAMYFGVQHDLSQGNEKDKNLKKEMELKKQLLGLAYRSKASAYVNAIKFKESAGVAPDNISTLLDSASVADLMEQFNLALGKYGNWASGAPLDDGHYLLLWAWKQRRLGYIGTALKALQKYISSSKNAHKDATGAYKECVKVKVEILKELNWDAWNELDEKWKILNFPKIQAHF
ncbi:tripeptidyl-peptidase II Tpp2 [Boothiomyces sp. JEL0866]|nr:tripeptidyl-peptidase II Tpp2 [Boothiomyces sp. JEL0866]